MYISTSSSKKYFFMFTEVLFTINQTWKQTTCPSGGEWIYDGTLENGILFSEED
jgi:hypothetical protein